MIGINNDEEFTELMKRIDSDSYYSWHNIKEEVRQKIHKLNMYISRFMPVFAPVFVGKIRPNALTQISYILYLLTVKIAKKAQHSYQINLYNTQNAVEEILPKQLGEKAIENAIICVSKSRDS